MAIKQISQAEYEKLTENTNPDHLDDFWLQELDPEQLFQEDWEEPNMKGLLVRVMNNIREPFLFHPKGEKVPRILLPTSYNYDMLLKVWPIDKAVWGFIIRETLADELGEGYYYFRNGDLADDGGRKLAKFDIAKEETH